MNDLIFAITLIVVVIITIVTKKLTVTAAIVAALIAIAIYSGTGFTGVLVLSTFFCLGVASTAWGKKQKLQLSVIRSDDDKRNAKQVVANGGIAAILGLLTFVFPLYENVLLLMMACSLSSATADTVSSELGMVYGKKFYNILSFKQDIKGENGVVSFEGTLAGIIGSCVLSTIFILCTEWNPASFIIIVVAGTIGNITDSVLGATLEKNNIIGNNAVNFLNTLIAALAGGLLTLAITW